jgi:hypothetical protein
MPPKQSAGKRGTRKIGRNKDKCKIYRDRNRLAYNKKRKADRIQRRLERRARIKENRIVNQNE